MVDSFWLLVIGLVEGWLLETEDFEDVFESWEVLGIWMEWTVLAKHCCLLLLRVDCLVCYSSRNFAIEMIVVAISMNGSMVDSFCWGWWLGLEFFSPWSNCEDCCENWDDWEHSLLLLFIGDWIGWWLIVRDRRFWGCLRELGWLGRRRWSLLTPVLWFVDGVC